ncbi:MAG: LysR family transcriptional regulator [Bacillota bacterium]|nr:LysR family transcriptional regulator [Bacillota bacterium]
MVNLKQLAYFIAAAEHGNISAAAKKLHIAQPPLSRQLSLLEEELHSELLIRSNRGVELTEAGRVFLDKARDIVKSLDELCEITREMDSGLRGEIRIGTIYSTIPILTEKIKYVYGHFPQIKFWLTHGTPNDLIDLLDSGNVDMIFLRSPTCETRDYHYQILDEDKLTMVMHRDLDPAPDNDELEIEQLRGLPLCMLRSGKYWGYNEFLVNECEKRGFTPNIICQCHDTSLALALVMERVGVSYQPLQSVEMLDHPHVYAKAIRDFEIKTYPTLIWNDNAHLSRSVKLFLSLFDAKSAQRYEALTELLGKELPSGGTILKEDI